MSHERMSYALACLWIAGNRQGEAHCTVVFSGAVMQLRIWNSSFRSGTPDLMAITILYVWTSEHHYMRQMHVRVSARVRAKAIARKTVNTGVLSAYDLSLIDPSSAM